MCWWECPQHLWGEIEGEGWKQQMGTPKDKIPSTSDPCTFQSREVLTSKMQVGVVAAGGNYNGGVSCGASVCSTEGKQNPGGQQPSGNLEETWDLWTDKFHFVSLQAKLSASPKSVGAQSPRTWDSLRNLAGSEACGRLFQAPRGSL